MKTALRIEVDQVVRAAADVALVREDRLHGDVPQRLVNGENRAQLLDQPLRGSLLEDLGEVDELRPRRVGVLLRLHLEATLVDLGIVTVVAQRARTAAATLGDLPAGPVPRPEALLHELLVELLNVDVDPPALPVDHDLDQVGQSRRYVLSTDMVEENLAQKARIRVGVQQVERLVAEQTLSVFDVIDRDVERPLLSCRHRGERGVAAKSNTDGAVGDAIDDEVGGDLHVGAVEVGELLLPVLLREGQEESSQHAWIVESATGQGLDVGDRDLLALPRLLTGRVAPRRGWPTTTAPEAATPSRSPTAPLRSTRLLDVLAGLRALRRVQPTVAVLVETLDELQALVSRPTTPTISTATPAEELPHRRALLLVEFTITVDIEAPPDLLGRLAATPLAFSLAKPSGLRLRASAGPLLGTLLILGGGRRKNQHGTHEDQRETEDAHRHDHAFSFFT